MNTKPQVGLGVLIFNDNNEVLLGKRLAPHGQFTWGPPGGHLEFGESFENCAIREVFEETGLTIQNPQFVAITNDIFVSDQKHYISIFMKADFPQEQIVKNCEPEKIEKWQWFNWNDLPENLFLPLKQLVEGKNYKKAM